MPQVKRLKEVIECHETQKKSKTEDSKSQSRYVLLSTYLDLDEISANIIIEYDYRSATRRFNRKYLKTQELNTS